MVSQSVMILMFVVLTPVISILTPMISTPIISKDAHFVSDAYFSFYTFFDASLDRISTSKTAPVWTQHQHKRRLFQVSIYPIYLQLLTFRLLFGASIPTVSTSTSTLEYANFLSGSQTLTNMSLPHRLARLCDELGWYNSISSMLSHQPLPLLL